MSNAQRAFIRQAGAGTVLHPDGHPLDTAGEVVTWSTYWQRRLAEGSIVCGTPDPAPTPAPKSAPKSLLPVKED